MEITLKNMIYMRKQVGVYQIKFNIAKWAFVCLPFLNGKHLKCKYTAFICLK